MNCIKKKLKHLDGWWRNSTTSPQLENDFKNIPSSSASSYSVSSSTSSCTSNCAKIFNCGSKSRESDNWYGKYKVAKNSMKKRSELSGGVNLKTTWRGEKLNI